MRFAVTGSAGLVGNALVTGLASKGHEVIALYSRTLPKDLKFIPKVELIQAPVQNLDALEKAFNGVDGVFHLAAYARPWSKDSSLFYEINEQGTKNVCQAAHKNGVKRVVYTASAGIHGPQKDGKLIDEHSWPNEYFTDYEQSKFNGMKAALETRTHGLEAVIVSPARVYAATSPSKSNVPVRMVNLYLNKGFGVAPLDGSGIGSYAFIDDVVQGHILAMEKGIDGEEYLIGGANHDYNSFFQTLHQVSGIRRPVLKVPYQLSLAIGKSQLFLADHFGVSPTITTPWVRRYLEDWGVDSSKIQNLGMSITPLEEGLEKVVKALREG